MLPAPPYEANERLRCLGLDAFDKTLTAAQIKARNPKCFEPKPLSLSPSPLPIPAPIRPGVIYVRPGDVIEVLPADE